MPRDWFEWHELYNSEPKLQQRLEIVREYIAYSLNASADGPIHIVSVCAGDGRDLLGTLKNHPRKQDVYARLVEINPSLVERGRATIESLGLDKQIEFINGDATIATNYVGAVPANIVLVCGVFGNLPEETELNRLLDNLSFLSKEGAFVIWTRGHSNGIAYSDNVRKTLRVFGFEEVNFKLTATGDMGIGINRYLGKNLTVPKEQQLFVFSGVANKAR
ncbi:type 12 methyltransferase [Nostoc linckia z18]|uniref:Type 12 methyltransferase n=2 Tax=Nostoc linckia TaxID=92942 RepID=A0A9Q5ZAV1_NOSLI|nr:class I SAM-dependent methyltransferase family protein [Nostoc linckia]PHK39623.1 type 12 methyltransferase [Nostoc linckia z15]PHK43314.1 type 12 methyltransferase [Nostoc linckia z16]PHJ57717.1 type 12 methyltransferase [Nostoc linckia z1]PHJ57901.1 type 12 methyltransferase [Nostoc linckia z3]PHJ69400.1 type 12 methyltransferase [Nostoc linckia z2]